MSSPSLVFQITRQYNAFHKQRNGRRFQTEPGNLDGRCTFAASGFANAKNFGVCASPKNKFFLVKRIQSADARKFEVKRDSICGHNAAATLEAVKKACGETRPSVMKLAERRVAIFQRAYKSSCDRKNRRLAKASAAKKTEKAEEKK